MLFIFVFPRKLGTVVQHRKHNVHAIEAKLSSQHPKIVIDDGHGGGSITGTKQVIVIQVMIQHVQISPILPTCLFRHHLGKTKSKPPLKQNHGKKKKKKKTKMRAYLEVSIVERSSESSTPRHSKLRFVVSVYNKPKKVKVPRFWCSWIPRFLSTFGSSTMLFLQNLDKLFI